MPESKILENLRELRKENPFKSVDLVLYLALALTAGAAIFVTGYYFGYKTATRDIIKYQENLENNLPRTKESELRDLIEHRKEKSEELDKRMY